MSYIKRGIFVFVLILIISSFAYLGFLSEKLMGVTGNVVEDGSLNLDIALYKKVFVEGEKFLLDYSSSEEGISVSGMLVYPSGKQEVISLPYLTVLEEVGLYALSITGSLGDSFVTKTDTFYVVANPVIISDFEPGAEEGIGETAGSDNLGNLNNGLFSSDAGSSEEENSIVLFSIFAVVFLLIFIGVVVLRMRILGYEDKKKVK